MKLSPEEIRFLVRDDGGGFNQEADASASDIELINHVGRGLVLMRTHMDEVTYNKNGNQITLVKRCQTPGGQDSQPST